MSIFDKRNCASMMNAGLDSVKYVIERRAMDNLLFDTKRRLRGINENLAKGNLTLAEANDLKMLVRRRAKWKWKALRAGVYALFEEAKC